MAINRYNISKLKTAFLYTGTEINKKEIKFTDSLIDVLMKGGDTEINGAIVMTLIGAIVGYNGIPRYFKEKIIGGNVNDNLKERDKIYCVSNVIDIINKMRNIQK
jgi:hypothetical protein